MKSKEILFLEWVAENHYRLQNVGDGVYYWISENDETGLKTSQELLRIYINQLDEN